MKISRNFSTFVFNSGCNYVQLRNSTHHRAINILIMFIVYDLHKATLVHIFVTIIFKTPRLDGKTYTFLRIPLDCISNTRTNHRRISTSFYLLFQEHFKNTSLAETEQNTPFFLFGKLLHTAALFFFARRVEEVEDLKIRRLQRG